MKRGIHPPYYNIEIVATDGSRFPCGSTKNVPELRATFDKYNHVAWSGGSANKTKTSRVMRFQSKYNQQEGRTLDSLFGGSNKEGDSKGA